MRRLAWLLLVPLVVAMAGASGDPKSLAIRADEAFDAGQAARAAELYDRYSLRTHEPARAAFNVATARYRQAREGQLAALGEAEVNYRACLGSDEYKARALCGLANCLLLRAETASALDRAMLRAAVDRYNDCLAEAGGDRELASDARYNKARARLLLMQAPPPAAGEDKPPEGDTKPDPEKQQDQPKQEDKGDRTDGPGDPTTPPKDGGKAERKDKGPKDDNGTHRQGKGGSFTPLSDDKGAPPPPKGDAEQMLEMAAQRILEEAAQHRRGKARPAGAGGKDW